MTAQNDNWPDAPIPCFAVIDRKLGRERADGQAHAEGIIEIDPRLSAKQRHKTLIHELTHLYFPQWSERKVISFTHYLHRNLWADGFRRVQQ